MTSAVAVIEKYEGDFDVQSYLASVSSAESFRVQQALSASYDAACRALIGPNDLQKDGGREFKRKSAWRKLARHFRISVAASLDSVRVDLNPDGFTAYAVATASAPWGQSWSDVGACGSDEATGRRTITMADAIATAMTRASNRAVSNLIAMGEVSAEEIGQRPAYAQRATGGAKRDEDKIMPFGSKKGQRLGDIDAEDLQATMKWCRANGKTEVATSISNVLANRALGETREPGEEDEEEIE